MIEFVGPGSQAHLYLMDDNCEHEKAKGISLCVI